MLETRQQPSPCYTFNMKYTPLPMKEREQMKESLSIEMRDSGSERHYENIIKFGSKIFNPSVSFMSLAGYCKQWFKSILGLDSTEAIPTTSLHTYSKVEGKMFVVKDAPAEETVFFNSSYNTLVRKNANVQFNHGFPLKASDEYSDGALGLLGTKEKNQKLRKDAFYRPEKNRNKKPELRQFRAEEPKTSDTHDRETLWTDAEKLAMICSWEYAVDSQKFLCSEYMYSLLRIPKERTVGSFLTLVQFFAEEDRAKLTQSWSQALLSGKEFNFTTRLVHVQENVWIKLLIKPVYKDTKLVKVIGTLQDVTDYKEAELRLLAEKEKAEMATKVKSEFVSLMSHEIRTPLSAIMGLTHLLMQKDNLAQEHKENLQSIHFSSQNMLALINNTLDFSRMEAGKVELEKVNFHFKDLLRNIHRSISIRAKEKQLKFELHMDENTPSEVAGDPARLTQILNNLLSNAIKFTDSGCVSLSVEVVYQSDYDWVLEFRVADTGVGIPEDRQHHIFESFVQASVATHRKYGGTGLGLAITKKIVELHNGNIQLESIPGEGSVFSVRLRYTKPNLSYDTLKPVEPADRSLSSLKEAKVLVVDDNPINSMVASKLLASWHAEVETAGDGYAAIEKIKSTGYDLVLMDLQMPIINGFDAIAEIRKLGYTMPVIALTANASADERKRILAVGGNDYLTKPFVPQELHDVLERHLQPLEDRTLALEC